jgi:hypothetical protein
MVCAESLRTATHAVSNPAVVVVVTMHVAATCVDLTAKMPLLGGSHSVSRSRKLRKLSAQIIDSR